MSGNGGEDGESDDSDGQSSETCHQRPVGSTSLSLDATLEILAHHDRRAIIDYLRDTDDQTATISELANHLASQKAKQSHERPGNDHIRTTLHHIHMPKLVDAGIVDYDARSQEIRYWGSERLETWHDRIQDRDD